MPLVRQSVGERVQAPLRLVERLVRGREDDPRRAQCQRHDPLLDRAHAHPLRRLIAPAPDHRRARAQAGGLCRLRRNRTRHLRAFMRGGQELRRNLERGQNRRRPVPRRQLQQRCAACAGLVSGVVAGQLVAHVVLGQKDLTDAAVDLRLVLLHPQNLGRGEACQRVITRNAHQIFLAQPQAHIIALFAGALVVPQDSRPQRYALLVQQHQPVHLPAHTDRGHLRRIDAGLLQRRAHALHRAVPPQIGVLFAPQRLWRLERVLGRAHSDDFALPINDQGLGSRGRGVDADTF